MSTDEEKVTYVVWKIGVAASRAERFAGEKTLISTSTSKSSHSGQHTLQKQASLPCALTAGARRHRQMQIPGLNLLYGEPPPIDANNDTLRSSSTGVTFTDNHKAETLQVTTPPSGRLDEYHIDGAGVESGISNGESSNDLATTSKSEMINPDADPLDIALAQNSDMSSPGSDAEDQPDDSDNERYSLTRIY